MTYRQRITPSTEGSKALRAALASQGINARVAKQDRAYRVVSEDARTLSALIALGFEGPLGGQPARSANSFFAYEFCA